MDTLGRQPEENNDRGPLEETALKFLKQMVERYPRISKAVKNRNKKNPAVMQLLNEYEVLNTQINNTIQEIENGESPKAALAQLKKRLSSSETTSEFSEDVKLSIKAFIKKIAAAISQIEMIERELNGESRDYPSRSSAFPSLELSMTNEDGFVPIGSTTQPLVPQKAPPGFPKEEFDEAADTQVMRTIPSEDSDPNADDAQVMSIPSSKPQDPLATTQQMPVPTKEEHLAHTQTPKPPALEEAAKSTSPDEIQGLADVLALVEEEDTSALNPSPTPIKKSTTLPADPDPDSSDSIPTLDELTAAAEKAKPKAADTPKTTDKIPETTTTETPPQKISSLRIQMVAAAMLVIGGITGAGTYLATTSKGPQPNRKARALSALTLPNRADAEALGKKQEPKNPPADTSKPSTPSSPEKTSDPDKTQDPDNYKPITLTVQVRCDKVYEEEGETVSVNGEEVPKVTCEGPIIHDGKEIRGHNPLLESRDPGVVDTLVTLEGLEWYIYGDTFRIQENTNDQVKVTGTILAIAVKD